MSELIIILMSPKPIRHEI